MRRSMQNQDVEAVEELARAIAEEFAEVMIGTPRHRTKECWKEVPVDLQRLRDDDEYHAKIVGAAVDAIRSNRFQAFGRLPTVPQMGALTGIAEEGGAVVRWRVWWDGHKGRAVGAIDWITDPNLVPFA